MLFKTCSNVGVVYFSIVNIGKSKTTSKKVKGLKSGKSYFVRIRTYKLVDGNKVISNWSTYKKIKVK